MPCRASAEKKQPREDMHTKVPAAFSMGLRITSCAPSVIDWDVSHESAGAVQFRFSYS